MKQLRITKQVTIREAPSLDKYLREIGKIKLLTLVEEEGLGRRIRNGDQKALETLVTSNLRFVVSVAKQYQNQGLTLPDLINEGNLGLIKAAELFDETRGFKFISYAVWWIRQAILQSLAEQSRIVRLPLNKIGSINKINKVFIQLEQDFHRDPTAEEIAEILDLQDMFVEDALNSTNFHISMDAPLTDNDENSENDLYDVMTINETPDPDSSLIDTSLKREIERTLGTLKAREADILRYTFGLNGMPAQTLEEIGKKLEITHERVRQIKEKALKKLKTTRRSSLLKPYLA
jgi:RNA polymerase primary sigma factor